MHNRIAAIFILLLIISGCTTSQVSDDLNERETEAPGYEKLVYEKDGETIDPDQMFPESIRPGMDWLKENTPSDAMIMSWWDYGHAIRAYAEREPVVDAPSKESLTTTVAKHLGKNPEEIDCDDCVDHEMLQEIAGLLLTESDSRAAELMESYGAGYLYMHNEDEDKSMAMFIILDEDQRPLENTVLGKALSGEPIEGFGLVYEDDICIIYGLV